MDFTLRCNALKCRVQLSDHAVVTTCSHIFCMDCTDVLGLAHPSGGARICPACDTNLPNPDDVVATQLNPTEDYKTSVLSGLSPSIIMECAGRALAFWAYQSTQEIVFQEYLARTLTEKYSMLNGQMEKIIHDANTEIGNLATKLEAVQMDREGLQRKNHELVEAYRDKNRKHLQTQELYDKLKKRTLLTQVQHAASDTVDEALQLGPNRYVDTLRNDELSPEHLNTPTNAQRVGLQYRRGRVTPGVERNPIVGNATHWHGLAQHEVSSTPGHRQRLPLGADGASSATLPKAFGNAGQANKSPTRQPLGVLGGNAVNIPGMSGYGMSAGMKIGKQPGTVQSSAAGGGARGPLSHLPTPGTRAAQSPALLRPMNEGLQGNLPFQGRGLF